MPDSVTIGVEPKPQGIPFLLSYVPGKKLGNACKYTLPLLPSGLVIPVAKTTPWKSLLPGLGLGPGVGSSPLFPQAVNIAITTMAERIDLNFFIVLFI